MQFKKLLVCISIILLQTFISYCVNAQFVSRREEPIVAGIEGGSPGWMHALGSLSGGGGWGSIANTPNGLVFSIIEDSYNDALIVGGSFDSIGGMSYSNIAKYDMSSGSWLPLGTGVSGGAVYCSAVYDTLVFAGGSFTTAGGTATNHIAVWNGYTWQTLASGLDSTVLAMTIMGDSLFVGGNFEHADGLVANYIAIWNLITKQWEAINDSGTIGMDGGVASLLFSSYTGTQLFVGGGFLHAGRKSASKITTFSGGSWGTLGSGVNDTDGVIECLGVAPYHGIRGLGWGNIIAGGHFSKIGNSAATDVAGWNGQWSPVEPYGLQSDFFSGVSGTIYALSSAGVHLYVGGDFVRVIGDSARFLLQLGGYLFSPDLDGPVYAILDRGVFFPEGYEEEAFIGGAFENAGGYHASHFAHWTEGADVAESKSNVAVSLTSFPNPVEQDATLSFTLAKRDHVVLDLFDELGQKIVTLADENYDAGMHEIPFHRSAADRTGILLAALKTSTAVSTCKVMLK